MWDEHKVVLAGYLTAREWAAVSGAYGMIELINAIPIGGAHGALRANDRDHVRRVLGSVEAGVWAVKPHAEGFPPDDEDDEATTGWRRLRRRRE